MRIAVAWVTLFAILPFVPVSHAQCNSVTFGGTGPYVCDETAGYENCQGGMCFRYDETTTYARFDLKESPFDSRWVMGYREVVTCTYPPGAYGTPDTDCHGYIGPFVETGGQEVWVYQHRHADNRNQTGECDTHVLTQVEPTPCEAFYIPARALTLP